MVYVKQLLKLFKFYFVSGYEDFISVTGIQITEHLLPNIHMKFRLANLDRSVPRLWQSGPGMEFFM